MQNLSPDQATLLAKYVTSTQENVYAIKDLGGIVGAVFARYSRAKGGFRETLLKEFISEGAIDPAHASDLIERILIAFGDDSVGELEGAHVAFEDVSMLATKDIEDRRLASYIEQSTRYVFYDMCDEGGRYRYLVPDSIRGTTLEAQYDATMHFIFETYCRLIEPMKAYYSSLKSIEEAEYDINGDKVKERYADLTDEADRKAFRMTYGADMRTKACDTLRFLLPLSTLTNLGVFGNGRFYENVLSYCYSSELPESRTIAKQAHAALNQVIPRYVQRAGVRPYNVATRTAMQVLTDRILAPYAAAASVDASIELADRGGAEIATAIRAAGAIDPAVIDQAMQDVSDEMMIACMLYQHCTLPLSQLRHIVRAMSPEKRREITDTYVGTRTTRRDRPGRAFEAGYAYTFDCVTDYGTYKDLQRHRMATQLRQRFTPKLGFTVPEDLATCGFAEDAMECHRRADALYDAMMAAGHTADAQYATMHGHRVRWIIGFNDRAAHHLIELRTGSQGHPSYRKVAMAMHDLITARSEWRGKVMAFADHGDYFWARGDSEARQRAKEKALEARKEKV
jgi:thymidylate synthase ThyX